MTSSLVGSEMCIRDRCSGRCGDLSSCSGRPGACSSIARRERIAALIPVSYTHLTLPTICSV
eukprot:5873687-Prorocentrum_lima.AAC.1